MSEHVSPKTYTQEYWAITGALLSMVFGGIGFGMALPLLPLTMNGWGLGEAMIGYNGMAQSLSLFIMCTIVVKVFRRFELIPTLLVSIAISVGAICLLVEIQNWMGWFILRLFLGGSFAFIWIGIEVWVNHLAPEHQRGRILAIYAACFAGPTALGPLLLDFIGTEGALPFYTIAALYLASAFPLLIGRKLQPDFKAEDKVSMRSMIGIMPFLLICAAMSGLGDGAAWNMLSLFGVKSGMTESSSLHLVSVFLFGSLICQMPIGYLADKMDRMFLLNIVATIGAVSCVGVAVSAAGSGLFWTFIFVAGGMLMGIYVLSLAILGQRFKGGMMAAANAIFVVTFEVGTFTGGPVSGALMEYVHRTSLLWMMAFACVVVMVGVFFSVSYAKKKKLAPA